MSILFRLPVLIALGIVPLIMHERVIIVAPEVRTFFPAWNVEYDYYLFWKSFTLIVCGAIAAIMSLWRQQKTYALWLDITFTVLMILEGLSMYFSNYPVLAIHGAPDYLEGTIVYVAYLLLACSACEVFSRRYMHEVRIALSMAVFGLTFFAILFFIQDPTITRHAFSSLGNGNHLALFASTVLPYFVATATLKENRGFFIVCLLCAIGLTIACGARMALLSTSVTSLIILKRYFKIRYVIGTMSIVLLVVFLVSPTVNGKIKQTVQEVTNITEVDKLASNRGFIWRHSIPLLSDKTILGGGRGSFFLEFPNLDLKEKAKVHWADAVISRPHNFYIQTWHASGLIFLIALLFWVFRIFDMNSKDDPHLLGIKMGIIGFLIAGFFTDGVVGVSQIFWIFLGLGVRLAKESEIDQSENLVLE